MNSTHAIFVVLALTAFFARFLRTPRVLGDVPMNPAQRVALWRRRFDDAMGANTEEALRIAAQGAEVKRRLLLRIRKIQAPATLGVVTVSRRMNQEPVEQVLQIRPLKFRAKPAEQPKAKRELLRVAR